MLFLLFDDQPFLAQRLEHGVVFKSVEVIVRDSLLAKVLVLMPLPGTQPLLAALRSSPTLLLVW